jgi:CHAT domain-containing protein/Tfp pilus assembly protein PilF
LEKDAKAGRYEARIEELRTASPIDARRVVGEQAFIDAQLLHSKADEQSRQKAIAKYQETLDVWIGIGDRPKEAKTLYLIGRVYHLLGDMAQALSYLCRSVPVFQAANDDSGRANALTSIGAIYFSMDQTHLALQYYNQALPIQQEVQDRLGEATTLANIGAAYDSLDETQKALDFLTHSLSILRGVDNPPIQALTLMNTGSVYNSAGEKQKALELLDQALRMFESLGDLARQAIALNQIGTVYASLDEPNKALDYFSKALSLFQKLKYTRGEALALNNIGQALATMDHNSEALEYFQRTLTVLAGPNNDSARAPTLNNIGALYFSLNDLQKALEYHNQALTLFQKMGSRSGEGDALVNIGLVLDKIGQKDEALDCYRKASSIFEALGISSHEGIALGHIGLLQESMGNEQEALNSYQKAIAKLEGLRAHATVEEIRNGLPQDAPFVYKASSLLMKRGQPVEAFNTIELARARTLLDQLGNVHPDIRNTTTPALLGEETELSLELVSLEQKLRDAAGGTGASLNSDVSLKTGEIEVRYAEAQRQYDDLITRLKVTNPEYASVRTVNTLSLPEVQKLLDGDVTLLSYFVGGDRTFAFVITRSSFHAVEIPVKNADLVDSIGWFRGFASLRDSQPETLRRLYNWLIGPVERFIKTGTVARIPHRELHYLPFAALSDRRGCFGDRHTLFYLPSASVLPFIRKKSKPVGTQMLALTESLVKGQPSLPYADEEAESVARIYNTHALTTSMTSKSAFLKRAEESSIIHVAAHADTDTASPLFYKIMLGGYKEGPEKLEIREIYGLNLAKASLVVLSGCSTGSGIYTIGDDVVALSRAFIYAGAPTVIASLWAVDDKATTYLMTALYMHLRAGMSKAEALQAAQSDTRKLYPHPYYWAGFVLMGDPGRSPYAKQAHHS